MRDAPFYSPERSPRDVLLDLDSTHNIFKDKIPKAKEEMEEKLQVSRGDDAQR